MHAPGRLASGADAGLRLFGHREHVVAGEFPDEIRMIVLLSGRGTSPPDPSRSTNRGYSDAGLTNL
jgi:hypothetical protein